MHAIASWGRHGCMRVQESDQSCGCEGWSAVAVRGKTESRVKRVHEVDGIVWLCGRVVILWL